MRVNPCNRRRWSSPATATTATRFFWATLTTLVIAVACSSGGGGTDAGTDVPPAPPLHTPQFLRCLDHDNLAPVRTTAGGYQCTPVGADAVAGAGLWPDTAGQTLADPIVYVQAGAAPGGDGTQSRPFADLATAVAATPATVIMSRGQHAIPSTVTLNRSMRLLGTGPVDGTSLVVPRGTTGLLVSGTTTDVSISNLSLGYSTSGMHGTGQAALRGDTGATVRLTQVAITDAFNGVWMVAGQLWADHVSVRGAVSNGIFLDQGSWGALTSLLIRDGTGYGLQAYGAHAHVHTALIAENLYGGVVLDETPPTRGGVADCSAPAYDPRGTATADCLSDVSIACNERVGLQVGGPARVLEGLRLQVSGTRAFRNAMGVSQFGDGLVATYGAEVHLDLNLNTDGDRGRGSEIVGNARSGIITEGRLDSHGAQHPGAVRVHGALIGSNGGPGVFAQSDGRLVDVSYCSVDDNSGVGIGEFQPASIVGIACNEISNTRLLQIPQGSVRLTMGDGLVLNAGTVDTLIRQNHISNNARFGGLFLSVNSGQVRQNTGQDNQFGLGAYASDTTMVIDSSNTIAGREAAPSIAPTLPSQF